jgi:hypothetical protein
MTRSRDVADTQDNLGGAVPPFAAGKNKIINGDFAVWQRGTSFTNLLGFFADRFQVVPSGSVTSMTTSQQSFTFGAAPVSGYEGEFFARNTITTVGSLTNLDLVQRIENVRTFAGQTVTLSFWAKGDSARNSIVYLEQTFGSGGSTTVYSNTPTLSITTSWVRYSFTISVPSIAGKTIGANNYLAVGIRQVVAAGSVLDIWGVQLEAGSVATPFQTASGSISSELELCQRYFYNVNFQDTTRSIYNLVGNGFTQNSTNAYVVVTFPVSMRIAPGSVTYTGPFVIDDGATAFGISNITINQSGANTCMINGVSSGMTAYRPIIIYANGSAAARLSFSAEL